MLAKKTRRLLSQHALDKFNIYYLAYRQSRSREYLHGCLTLPFPIIISDFSLFATTESPFPLLTTELALVCKSPHVGINNNCNSHAGHCLDECTAGVNQLFPVWS